MSHRTIGRHPRTRALFPGLLALLALLPLAIHPARSEPTPGPRLTAGSQVRPDETRGSPAETAKIEAAYGQLPLTFVPNRGQTDASVHYSGRAAGLELSFTSQEVVMALGGPHDAELALRFVDANPEACIDGQQEAPGKVNYLLGDDPSRWRTGLRSYAAVRYRELWPGIDVVFRGKKGALKYDFELRPGAQVEHIRLAYRGAEAVSLLAEGSLRIRTTAGTLTDERPVSWQRIEGRRAPVASRYLLRRGPGGEVECGFAVGEGYDPAYPLTIDPSLAYGTFLGEKSDDFAHGIAVGGDGTAYVVGETVSRSFPVTSSAFDRSHNGSGDVFVTKLNASGTGLVYSTFLGGSGYDQARYVVVDASGSACVVGGTTSSNFPTTSNAFDRTANGGQDVFVTTLNSAGSGLLYSTYLGGTGTDEGYACALGPDAEQGFKQVVYVSGHTDSTNFPVPGGFDTSLGGIRDIFVAKLDLSFSGAASVRRATYLGGSDEEKAGSHVVVDSAGRAYVKGITHSADLLTSYGAEIAAGAYDDEKYGDSSWRDSCLAILRADWSGLEYATFRGGSGLTAMGNSFAIREVAGEVIVYMVSPAYVNTIPPTTPGAYDTTHSDTVQDGEADAYLMVLKPDPADNAPGGPDTGELVYATFLGGSGNGGHFSLAADPTGDVYLYGITYSLDLPLKNPFDSVGDAGGDCFIAKLRPDGSLAPEAQLIYSSYLGGSGEDQAVGGIAVDSAGSAYVAGATLSGNLFPSGLPGYDKTKSSKWDAFAAKINP